MAGDPTPMEYDEPVTVTEWGVVVPGTDEAARFLTEDIAREIVEKGRPGLKLVKRQVTYEPWTVVGRRSPRA